MKIILIVFVAFLGLPSFNALNLTMSDLKDIAMKMKNATQYVSEANSALKAEDVGKFITAIGNLVSLIPGPVGIIGGGVLGLAAAFIPGEKVPTELSIVLGELEKVGDKLHDLSNTVESAKGELVGEIRKTFLSSYEKYMNDIDGDYKAVLERSTPIKKNQMKSTCNKVNYHSIARWFKEELEGKHTTSSIVSQVRSQNDRKAYFDFAKVLIGNFVRATVLQTACTSIIYSDHSQAELDKILAEDAKEYQELLDAMKNKLKEEDDKIVETFWKVAVSDIEAMANGKSTMEHAMEANLFLQHLQQKFYWRKWLVIVYGDQETTGFKKHKHQWHGSSLKSPDYESHFKLFIRLHNRNIVIASPDPNPPASFKDKAVNCIEKVGTAPEYIHKCDVALALVKECMKDERYNAIGCMRNMRQQFAAVKDTDAVVLKDVTTRFTELPLIDKIPGKNPKKFEFYISY